jgi:hypothetical protein
MSPPLLSRSQQRSGGQKQSAESEEAAAGRASHGWPGLELALRQGRIEAVAQFDQSADAIQRDATVGIHKAIAHAGGSAG